MINHGIISISNVGGSSSSSSGIYTINGESGPNITITSYDNTIRINAGSNNIDLSCSGFANTKYIGFFTNITSGNFVHGLNTSYFNYNVYSSGTYVEPIIEDNLRIIDENTVDIFFNSNETGFVVIQG